MSHVIQTVENVLPGFLGLDLHLALNFTGTLLEVEILTTSFIAYFHYKLGELTSRFTNTGISDNTTNTYLKREGNLGSSRVMGPNQSLTLTLTLNEPKKLTLTLPPVLTLTLNLQ